MAFCGKKKKKRKNKSKEGTKYITFQTLLLRKLNNKIECIFDKQILFVEMILRKRHNN